MKKNKPFLIILLIIFTIIIYHLSNRYYRNSYGVNSVAKIYKIKSIGKTYYVQYIYYLENKKHYSENQIGFNNKCNENKYYKIIYSSKNPKNVEIFLDEEITDTFAILKAGFSREDIKNMPK